MALAPAMLVFAYVKSLALSSFGLQSLAPTVHEIAYCLTRGKASPFAVSLHGLVYHCPSRLEVETYLSRLLYALESEATLITFQVDRNSEQQLAKKYRNKTTISKLFPDEDTTIILKQELSKLTIDHYIETLTDNRFPERSEMRVFGKTYGTEDVYIKIRVELTRSVATNHCYVFVMSFHFALRPFKSNDFPYRKQGVGE